MFEHNRIIRFVVVGLINTGFGYLSYTILVINAIPLWLSIIGSMAAALLFNFLTYGGLVFNNISRRNLPRFLIFYSAVALVNYGALCVLGELGITPIWGQAILLPVLAIVCYAGLKIYVYRASGQTGPR